MGPGPAEQHIFTGGPDSSFENYVDDHVPELSPESYGAVRREIADYYHIPAGHVYYLPDTGNRLRTDRAFTVIITPDGQGYYVDGRMPHSELFLALDTKFHVSLPEEFQAVSGFLDPNGFPNQPTVQEKAKELGHPLHWFVRDKDAGVPESPVELH